MPFTSLHLRLQYVLLMLLIGLFASPHCTSAADKKYWELSPYRIELHLSVADSQQPQPELGTTLLASLQRQIRSTIYPLWAAEVKLTTGAEKQHLLSHLHQLNLQMTEEKEIEELIAGRDKHIYINVRRSTLGVVMESREFDCSTLRWGTVQSRTVRQNWMLAEQCFDLVCQTFSPLATIRSMADKEEGKKKDQEVLLNFRGSDLPQQSDLSFLKRLGEVYQPLMVRTNSRGEIKIGSIRPISWTFLTLAEHQEDGWHGAVHTGTRRPFGVRRRGRIEHFALAVRQPTGSTTVRFHARHDKTQGLSGYEVFRREPGSEESQSLGLTDSDGAVEIAPGENEVIVLFLRSEGQLLAKVPVVPGAASLIEVPVADDTARLRAQAALTSLTEQIVDTVAQRNILIARVRAQLAKGEIEKAQELFLALDSLPGRTQFDQQIKSAENRQLNNSKDPKVQARIEKLFSDTRKLLVRFLSTKQISELQGELNAARRAGAG